MAVQRFKLRHRISTGRYGKWLSTLTLVLALISASCEASGEYEMETFDLGNGRSIEILASKHLEVTQSFYYQVKVNQQVVVPIVMICVGIDRGQLKFKTLFAKSGDLVGVFEQRNPQEILAIHDFKTNTTWPGAVTDGGSERYQQHEATLLQQLQIEHPEMTLKMGQNHACGG